MNAQAGREGVSLSAVVYLVGFLAVLGGFAYWAHISTTPRQRVFGVTPSPEVVYNTSTPDSSLLPAIVFGPSPSPEREIRPYGFLGDTVIGPAQTAMPTSEGDNLELINVTQISITPTPEPDMMAGLFRVYLFMDPVSKVEFLEYPHLVVTPDYLPPGVLVIPPDVGEPEALATLDVAQRRYQITAYASPTFVYGGNGGFVTFTPSPVPSATPTPTATLRPYQHELMATVTAWESISAALPPAPALAVGGGERFSETPPLAQWGGFYVLP